jgi:gluconate 2-dehydrogenase gamma chain
MISELNRRRFLLQAGTGVSAAWIAAHWPSVLSAATHAQQAVKSAVQPKLEFFTPGEAIEIDAISARVIPTDETPGAHEAGVVYFIDRALLTFASDAQPIYRNGFPTLRARVKEFFPAIEKFSSATPDQQDRVLHSFAPAASRKPRAFGAPTAEPDFFEIVRQHTIIGFLIDPDTRGDSHGYGWKLIGREREHMFQSPFGFYDKDYPGWQPLPKATETK